jgi:hypothetical protein
VRLVDAITALHESLEEGGLPHAFGGALALAWCTGEPRATADIDVNIFVDPSRAAEVTATLPPTLVATDAELARLVGDGQVRLMWGRIPVDIFLSNADFHDVVANDVVHHTFAGSRLPFLSCASLAVFKAFFNRDKDWVDIREMLRAGRLDADQLLGRLVQLLGPDDPRVASLLESIDEVAGEAVPERP